MHKISFASGHVVCVILIVYPCSVQNSGRYLRKHWDVLTKLFCCAVNCLLCHYLPTYKKQVLTSAPDMTVSFCKLDAKLLLTEWYCIKAEFSFCFNQFRMSKDHVLADNSYLLFQALNSSLCFCFSYMGGCFLFVDSLSSLLLHYSSLLLLLFQRVEEI